MLTAPLNERTAQLSWTTERFRLLWRYVRATVTRGAVARPTIDRSAGGDPKVALLGLLVAAALGALHAFSPGHGKTVVAYL